MNRLLHLAWAVALLLIAAPVRANDGTYYTSGNQLVPLQETRISIQREVLTISLMDNGYAQVDVQYEFFNPEKAPIRLLMGFEADPPFNDGYRFHPDGRHPNISRFSVEVNGQPLAYRNAACVADTLPLRPIDTTRRYYVWDNNLRYEDHGQPDEPSGPGIDFAYVYYFEADFQPGVNRVHHSYTYRMSVVVGTPYHVSYKLTPATRWAGGHIADFTLNIRADHTAKHFLVFDTVFGGTHFTVGEGMGKMRPSTRFGDPCTEVSLRNGAITLHKTDFAPTDELYLLAAGDEKIYDIEYICHIGGTYDRAYQLAIPVHSDGKTVPADKAFCQRVVRNLPYANRGHVFADRRLRQYFESLWWYMPDPSYSDDTSDFTEVDWQCVHYRED